MSITEPGTPLELLVTRNVAFFVPTPVGAHAIFHIALCVGPTTVVCGPTMPLLIGYWVLFVTNVAFEIVSAASPVLVTITVCSALALPTSTLPYESETTFGVATGAPVAMPAHPVRTRTTVTSALTRRGYYAAGSKIVNVE